MDVSAIHVCSSLGSELGSSTLIRVFGRSYLLLCVLGASSFQNHVKGQVPAIHNSAQHYSVLSFLVATVILSPYLYWLQLY